VTRLDLEVAPQPQSPRPEAAFRGVLIALDEDSGKRARIFGAFRLDAAQARAIAATPLQRALALVVASEYHSVACNLAGDQALFEDDQTLQNGVYAGFFDFELGSLVHFEPGRKYWVVVSLGPCLSNTLAVEV